LTLRLSEGTKQRYRQRELQTRKKNKINFIRIAIKLVDDAKAIIKREGQITDWDLQQALECNDHQFQKCMDRVLLDSNYIQNKHIFLYNKQHTLENEL